MLNVQVKDKSDFFAAIMKASRLLLGNDEEQAGHIVYLTDGRLMTKNFAERIEYLDACMPGSLHILTLASKPVENSITQQIVQRVKQNGKRASLVTLDLESANTFAEVSHIQDMISSNFILKTLKRHYHIRQLCFAIFSRNFKRRDDEHH